MAYLNVPLLLDAGLTCAAVGYVRFVTEGYAVPIMRGTLVDMRRHLPRFADLGAYVDELGLHLRWRGGRGQLNFKSQVVVGRVEVLDVHLRDPDRRQYGAILGGQRSQIDVHDATSLFDL